MRDHLGNNRIVANQTSGVVQSTQYYPFGMAFADGTGTDKQPYKYNGKELDTMHGLNQYDYSARYYDPAFCRFTTVDPMAEKYYSLSQYVYCANNPMKYIDPDGREFTDNSWSYISRLTNDISTRFYNNSVRLATLNTEINAGGLSNKQIRNRQNEINRLESQNEELSNTLGEIRVLAQSDQMYHIKTDNSMNINGIIPGTGEYRSGAEYNFANGNFEIRLGDGSLGSIAHELKHAYQFETGALSTGYMRDGTPFYDKSDEREAYTKGTLFGVPRVNSLPSIYDNLQSGPRCYSLTSNNIKFVHGTSKISR